MIRPFRVFLSVLMVMGLFTLSSCMRSQYGSNSSCYSPRCEPIAPTCCQPDDLNCFAPCGPDFYPCGGGKCGSVNGSQPCFPEEICYRNMRSYETCDDCNVYLRQCAPEFATVGAPYPIEIHITAVKECAAVEVNQTLPCDSTFIKSEPSAIPNEDGTLTWSFPHMTEGQTQSICVWVKPSREGCCLAAATVCACPQLCAYTNCGQPVVCINKCGPACGCLNCPVNYVIDVCNSGSATAYDVVVTDTVPDGLVHCSGMRCLRYELGALCPGDSKRICVEFCACKPGMVCNTATVTYCGGPDCSAEACTMINEPCVEVTKTGPDWAYICKTVEYTITVTNPGDLVLRDVIIDDVSAPGTVIVAAPGAEVCCNRAIWCIPEFCPGETRTFTVSVKSQVPGKLCNKVAVTSQSDCGPCTECAEACTLWKGIPAVHMCMVDTTDPICIGESTVYRVCVTNRGTADDHNVKLVIKFTDELQPQSVNGPTKGTISGQTVTFEPIDKMLPKQSFEFCVTVKGVSVGDARGEATLSSDMLSSPVVDTESTHVY
ncbi:MAG: OmcB family cysteine-rich outer membrane protein [Chlamydiia bacterium]|nr:OmcB family cysteine-rich outer membrane protein [Chlamydiia bacterium]